MKFIFDGYDLTLAVAHRRVLLYEHLDHNNQERAELVWQPTQHFLEEIGKENPKQVICFFGRQMRYPKKQGCAICYLYVINSRKEVTCIGTIFNALALACYQTDLPKCDVALFKKYGKERVSRGRLPYCVIPSNKEIIDEQVIMESAKKFFASFPKKSPVAKLANALICLFSADNGAELEDKILAFAKKTAAAVSSGERLKKFMDDRA